MFHIQNTPQSALPAPALVRGIQLLRLLEQAPEATLESLAAKTGIPKASAVRLLRTLMGLDLVVRAENKTYSAAARLVPLAHGPADLTARVRATLRRLCSESEQTAEWYVPAEQGMVLVLRHEPESQHVRVSARIGFLRSWHDELDAVACIAIALRGELPDTLTGYWTYGADGKRTRLRAGEVRERILQARVDRCACDRYYNTNGVRRIACGVEDEGRLVGVLALAGSYRPGTPDAVKRNTRLLAGCTSSLCS